jgi:hypothetical protein
VVPGIRLDAFLRPEQTIAEFERDAHRSRQAVWSVLGHRWITQGDPDAQVELYGDPWLEGIGAEVAEQHPDWVADAHFLVQNLDQALRQYGDDPTTANLAYLREAYMIVHDMRAQGLRQPRRPHVAGAGRPRRALARQLHVAVRRQLRAAHAHQAPPGRTPRSARSSRTTATRSSSRGREDGAGHRRRALDHRPPERRRVEGATRPRAQQQRRLHVGDRRRRRLAQLPPPGPQAPHRREGRAGRRRGEGPHEGRPADQRRGAQRQEAGVRAAQRPRPARRSSTSRGRSRAIRDELHKYVTDTVGYDIFHKEIATPTAALRSSKRPRPSSESSSGSSARARCTRSPTGSDRARTRTSRRT